MFNRKPQQLTGKKLTTNGEQCCEPVDSTVSDFEYNEETGELTITLNTGETFTQAISMSFLGGTSASRPVGVARVLYMRYFDDTLGYPIWWNGVNWVNSTGAIV